MSFPGVAGPAALHTCGGGTSRRSPLKAFAASEGWYDDTVVPALG
ncbi:hypothetical protein ABN028_25835 [Actinopolymorpha sp. B17G11]